MEKFKCRICNTSEYNQVIKVKDMMTGSFDSFNYVVCSNCNTIQIEDYVKEMNKYYNNEVYYSFVSSEKSKLVNYLLSERNKFGIFGEKSVLGWFLNNLFPVYTENKVVGQILKCEFDKSILDVGCGNGDFIKLLAKHGFNNCIGIDPFLNNKILNSKTKLFSKSIFELEVSKKFDLIRIHHVFEHMESPKQVISKIENLLSNSGTCVITIPIADYIFCNYKEDSYILQAPHHFFLMSIKGFEMLIANSNLKIIKTIRNAVGISNWIKLSELWKNGIAMNQITRSLNSYFTLIELFKFFKVEKYLQRNKLGDNVSFVLKI